MIGIKQPYLRLSLAGTLNIRNDNPQNVIIQFKGSKALELKERANELFKKREFVDAIKIYLQAMQCEGCDNDLKFKILSNVSQCFLNLGLNEDSLFYADEALKLNENDFKSLIRKAKSLAYLREFDESL